MHLQSRRFSNIIVLMARERKKAFPGKGNLTFVCLQMKVLPGGLGGGGGGGC